MLTVVDGGGKNDQKLFDVICEKHLITLVPNDYPGSIIATN